MQFNDRPFDVFISYSHEDMEFAQQIHAYLRDAAGLKVWRDELMPGAAPIADAINRNIENSRALLLIYSKNSRGAAWVQDELRTAIEQKNSNNGMFKIIGVILDDLQIPAGLANQKCLQNAAREIDLEFGFNLLASFYPFQDANIIAASRDVFVSRSWRADEADKPDAVCRMLIKAGFRLVGDSKDWKNFTGDERVKEIIRSCGALVAIVPLRANDPCGTSRYILKEISWARELGVPYLIIADDEVSIDQSLVDEAIDGRVIRVSELDLGKSTQTFPASILFEEWREPQREHYGFFATNFKTGSGRSLKSVSVAERVTGMRCLTGREFDSNGAQEEIVKRISNSMFFIGDLSNLDISRGNVLVEIGVALGAKVHTEIVSIRSDERPHVDIFMFRGRELKYASNEAEFVAKVHAVCRKYRRRIFNWEFEEAGLLD